MAKPPGDDQSPCSRSRILLTPHFNIILTQVCQEVDMEAWPPPQTLVLSCLCSSPRVPARSPPLITPPCDSSLTRENLCACELTLMFPSCVHSASAFHRPSCLEFFERQGLCRAEQAVLSCESVLGCSPPHRPREALLLPSSAQVGYEGAFTGQERSFLRRGHSAETGTASRVCALLQAEPGPSRELRNPLASKL